MSNDYLEYNGRSSFRRPRSLTESDGRETDFFKEDTILKQEDSKQERVSKDKYTRVYAITPILEAGMVYLKKDAPYLFEFLDECESFTADDTHPHDDQVDPMVYAINGMIAQCVTPWWKQVTG